MSKKLFCLFVFISVFLFSLPASLAAEKDQQQEEGQKETVQEQSSETREAQPAQDLGLTEEELAFLRNHPVIRVGNEEGWAPFDFNEHGEPMGYAIDHLELLGEKLGISFEYVNGYTWSELLELFKQGKIDLLPSLWISESRKRYMLFTEPFLKLPYVLITESGREDIKNFEDLKNGPKVAVAKGYVQEKVLKKSYPEIELHIVKNALEGLKAVNYGNADAYIGYRGTVDYLIATRFFTDLKIKGEVDVPGLGPQGLYIAVQKSMPELRGALQKAMDSVKREQKVKLARKWISVEETPFPALSKEEKEFLRENRVLRVDNLMSWPPFNFHENGRPKGFCVDYMDLLAEKLGLEIDYVSGPTWNEFMEMLQNGEIDLLIDVVKTPKRKEFIDFTSPYFVIFPGIVTKKGNEELSNLEALAGKKVAVPEDFYFEEILKEHYPDVIVQTKRNILECLKSVSFGEVSAALAEKPVFDYLISKHFLMDLQSVPIMDNEHFDNTPVALGVSKGRDTLKSILQKTMDVVSENKVKALKQKWLEVETPNEYTLKVAFDSEERKYLQQKNSIKMCVHPSWMPFEGIDEDKQHTGIIADIMKLVSERIGVPIELVPTKSWQQSLERARAGQCDIVSSLQKDSQRRENFVFSKPYMESVGVIVARSDEPYIPSMSSLAGKEVAIVHGDPVEGYIENNYPQIKINCMPTVKEVLNKVSKGEVDVGIAGLQMISYKLHELGLYDLKIAGQTPFKKFLRVGIDKEESELRSILNKAIDSISSQEISRITQKWLTIKYEHGFNYSLFWKILAGVAVVVLGFMYWNRKLFKLNRQIAEAHQELAEKSKELERLSVTDSLTGIYNRMRLEELLEQEAERGQRYHRPLSVIMLDIDKFKYINDTYGHQTGDTVLREIAKILCSNIRHSDVIGRWGGEEFLVICPETESQGALSTAEKLRENIEGLQFLELEDGITCSFGVAELRKDEKGEELVNRADCAMYRAKERGRNQVACATEEALKNRCP
jgi:polar amino acid transport system substrate-binding protein